MENRHGILYLEIQDGLKLGPYISNIYLFLATKSVTARSLIYWYTDIQLNGVFLFTYTPPM